MAALNFPPNVRAPHWFTALSAPGWNWTPLLVEFGADACFWFVFKLSLILFTTVFVWKVRHTLPGLHTHPLTAHNGVICSSQTTFNHFQLCCCDWLCWWGVIIFVYLLRVCLPSLCGGKTPGREVCCAEREKRGGAGGVRVRCLWPKARLGTESNLISGISLNKRPADFRKERQLLGKTARPRGECAREHGTRCVR